MSAKKIKVQAITETALPELQLVRDKRQNPMQAHTYNESDHALANSEFIARHAKPGSLVLLGGSRTIEQMVRVAQSHLAGWSPSLWSHICIYEGLRADGQHWLLMSDIDIRGGKLLNGYVETPTGWYENPFHYPNVAILDFGLPPETLQKLFAGASQIKQTQPRYPLFKILITLASGLFIYFVRGRAGRWLARKRDPFYRGDRAMEALSCSSLVRRLYLDCGIDLAPGVEVAGTSPEEIFKTPHPHERYLLLRQQRRAS